MAECGNLSVENAQNCTLTSWAVCEHTHQYHSVAIHSSERFSIDLGSNVRDGQDNNGFDLYYLDLRQILSAIITQ